LGGEAEPPEREVPNADDCMPHCQEYDIKFHCWEYAPPIEACVEP